VSEGRWEYVAVLPPGSDAVAAIVRVASGASRDAAESLRATGRWGPSAILVDAHAGRGWGDDLRPMSRSEAAAQARRWVAAGRIAGLPPDLADADPTVA
jgi:hypothetical protein